MDLSCNYCSKNDFRNRRSLKKHIKRVHVEPKYECSYCEKKFKEDKNLMVIFKGNVGRNLNKIFLQEHIAARHSTGSSLYSCKFCPKTFNSSANMSTHRKKHHPEKYELMKPKYLQPWMAFSINFDWIFVNRFSLNKIMFRISKNTAVRWFCVFRKHGRLKCSNWVHFLNCQSLLLFRLIFSWKLNIEIWLKMNCCVCLTQKIRYKQLSELQSTEHTIGEVLKRHLWFLAVNFNPQTIYSKKNFINCFLF